MLDTRISAQKCVSALQPCQLCQSEGLIGGSLMRGPQSFALESRVSTTTLWSHLPWDCLHLRMLHFNQVCSMQESLGRLVLKRVLLLVMLLDRAAGKLLSSQSWLQLPLLMRTDGTVKSSSQVS